MNIVSAVKNALDGNRGRLLFSGALLGIYINVLLAVPFMCASEFFLVFMLIALSAVAIPMAIAAWSQKEPQPRKKAQLILKGMTASSAVSALIYLTETLVGNYVLKILANPVRFSVSRAPHISLVISIILLSLSILTSIKLKK